jgi:hypothetical protein
MVAAIKRPTKLLTRPLLSPQKCTLCGQFSDRRRVVVEYTSPAAGSPDASRRQAGAFERIVIR